MILRFLPLIGMLLFIALGLVWRAWLQYRRHGTTGYALFRSSNWRESVRDSLLFVLLAVPTSQAVAAALAPESLAKLYVVAPPSSLLAVLLGGVLLLGGTVLTVMAQLQMGASWRVGIDEKTRPGVVTKGLYGFCRNPIYFAMFTTLAGLMILQPTWISLAVLVASIVGFRIQVLKEESFLLKTYGATYRAYARRVGRFLPGLGRLTEA